MYMVWLGSMADKDDIREGKDFGIGIPQQNRAFHVKGAGALDWGMQNRLARIFNPASGRTVMLAFDHDYFQGPTTGLERIDLNIVPLIPYADVLMCTRGALRSVIPAGATNAVVLRCSGGQSILTELSRELIAVDIEDAIRLNAAAITTQIYIGAEYEHQSIKNLVQLIDTGNRYGIPTMAVTGVGAEMKRDERYFALATRIAAELGAHYVKSYFIETPEIVAERVRLCLQHAPAERLVFAPDCGLSQTARWAAKQKLANMVAGVRAVRKERA